MKQPVHKLDFPSYCKPCGLWCCQGENPYASQAELAALGVSAIGRKPDDTCIFLENSLCSVYDKRPLECRIFPFDIHDIDGDLMWVLWDVCPAGAQLDIEQSISYLEKTLLPRYSRDYVDAYMAYHSVNEPEKYQDLTVTKIREVDVTVFASER